MKAAASFLPKPRVDLLRETSRETSSRKRQRLREAVSLAPLKRQRLSEPLKELSQLPVPVRRSARLQAKQQPGQGQGSPSRAAALRREPRRSKPPLKLTQKNLRLLNRITKSAVARSKQLSSASRSRRGGNGGKATTVTTTIPTKSTTSITSAGSANLAYENGLLDPPHSAPPANLEELRRRIDRPRGTASPPESVYRTFAHNVHTAPNKDSMVHITSSKLLKEYEDEADLEYVKVFNQGFNAFPADVGFNNRLSAPQPDMIEGLQKPAFSPFPVQRMLGGAAVLIDDPSAVTLPHLAGEWKARGRDMDKARLQSAYDGAALVYGRQQALSYLEAPDAPGHAAVSTFTMDGTGVRFFAHYAAPKPRDGDEDELEDVRGDEEDGEDNDSDVDDDASAQVEYHQFAVTSTLLTNSYEDFKRGRRQLRNVQDDARAASYKLRNDLVGHWKKTSHWTSRRAAALTPTQSSQQSRPKRATAKAGAVLV